LTGDYFVVRLTLPQPLHPSTFTRLEVKLQVVHAVDHKPWHELDPSTRISLISASATTSVLSAAVFRYQVLQAARDMGLERIRLFVCILARVMRRADLTDHFDCSFGTITAGVSLLCASYWEIHTTSNEL